MLNTFSFSTTATTVGSGNLSQSKAKTLVVAEEIGNLLKKVAIEKAHMKNVSAKKSVCE